MQHDKLDGIARSFVAFIVRNFYGIARKGSQFRAS